MSPLFLAARRKIGAKALLGVCLILGAGYAWAEDEARAWLEKMNEALATRNYDGTFVHLRHGKAETLRIIHRVDNGRVTERLISLDGNRREFIRNDDQLTCFLPDQRRVLVEQRPSRDPLMGRLPAFDAALDDYYLFRIVKQQARVPSGRKTKVIEVTPKDGYRFGYCLWIDEQTAIPIQTQLRDARGRVIEQVVFSELKVLPKIPKTEVQPHVNSEGFQWIRQQAPPEPVEAPAWRAERVPPGFKLKVASSQVAEGSKSQLSHLVYSDGLASVSVFIEQAPKREALKGPQRVGSAFTFSTLVQGHQVTAVGEVPVQTVKLIAGSTKPSVAAASALSERP